MNPVDISYYTHIHSCYMTYYIFNIVDSLLKAREMTKKGLTKTDISSAEDYDNVRTKRKIKTTTNNMMMPSFSCPTYSGILNTYVSTWKFLKKAFFFFFVILFSI